MEKCCEQAIKEDRTKRREYEQRLQVGFEYQDFVMEHLYDKYKFRLLCYSSMKYQKKRGESMNGWEIKYDNIMKSTGNLFIETEEKRGYNQEEYVAAGIYKKDNTVVYAIGDYNELYIFNLDVLLKLHKDGVYEMKENAISRARGFIISKEIAKQHARQVEVFE